MNCNYCKKEVQKTVGKVQSFNRGAPVYCNSECKNKLRYMKEKAAKIAAEKFAQQAVMKPVVHEWDSQPIRLQDWNYLHENISKRWTGKMINYTAARGAGCMP